MPDRLAVHGFISQSAKDQKIKGALEDRAEIPEPLLSKSDNKLLLVVSNVNTKTKEPGTRPEPALP